MQGEHIMETARILVENEILGNKYSVHYKAELEKNVQDFFNWCIKRSKRDLRTITKKDLLNYHKKLEETKSKKDGEPLKANTINSRFHAVTLIFQLLYQTGLIEENPCQNLDLKIPDRQFFKRRPFTVDEINTFLEKIDVSTKRGLKDRTIFELMYSSGLRCCEIVNLKIGDIDFNQREMIVRGKFGKDRVVPVSVVAKDFLLLYLGERIEMIDEPVFISYAGSRFGKAMKTASISERFHDLLKEFGMDKKEITAHSIRHSTATHLLDNGASIRHVQELLGHKEIATTERYTHVQTEGVFKVFRKYHPREHDLFEAVDDDYIRHLNSLIEKFDKFMVKSRKDE